MQHLKSVYYASVFVLIFIFFSTALFSQPFSVFGISDLTVAFTDGYKLPEKKQELDLFGIHGEIISGQLVIHAEKNLSDVDVKLTDLADNSTGKTIASANAEWNFVGNIRLEKMPQTSLRKF
jgi:hypothetical protein